MRQLYQAWIDNLPYLSDADYAEPPPDGFDQIQPVSRFHCMEHPTQGMRDDVSSDQVESMRHQGWRLLLGKDDFLELVHLQAWYLQVRFFPRLQWIILDAPPGRFFVRADRAVVWGFADRYDVAPSTLRLPNVQVLAPLTRSVALFAFHPSGQPPEMVTPLDVNRVMASAAYEWIAGPTRETVLEALSQKGHV